MSVTDDRERADAQERRAAALGVVDALPESAERITSLGIIRERRTELLAQHVLDELDEALAHLQRNVPREAVAHDDVGLPGEEIARFEVADEVQSGVREQPMRVADQLRALAGFFADREQPDARVAELLGQARVSGPHHTELAKMLRT